MISREALYDGTQLDMESDLCAAAAALLLHKRLVLPDKKRESDGLPGTLIEVNKTQVEVTFKPPQSKDVANRFYFFLEGFLAAWKARP